MSDDLGIRKLGRRRKTTRRLTRRPVRVPGDDVPRDGAGADEDETDIELDTDSAEGIEAHERQSADLIDVDLELDEEPSEAPTSGVMQAPSRDSAPPSAAVAATKPAVEFYVELSEPHPSPPSAAAAAPLPAGARAAASASVETPVAAAHEEDPDEHDTDPATNPKIRLPEDAQPTESVSGPASKRSATDADDRTRPRIDLSEEMALAAGRVTSYEVSPVRGEELDSETNPHIRITVEEPSEPVFAPAVVVTRAKIISDRPPDQAEESTASRRSSVHPRPSQRSPAVQADAEEIETLDIDDAIARPAPDANVVTTGASALRPADVGVRQSKVPPPPPSDASGKPQAKKTPSLDGRASTAPTAVQKAPPPPPPTGAPKKSAQKPQPKRRYWWEDFFSDDYLQSVLRPTSAQISKQVDFIEASLGLATGEAVLDVGCGLGQHAIELARRGYLVVGIDLSLPMITRAAEEAQQEGLRINFLHADMREMAFSGMFDAIICVGTTFGFFDDEGNRDVLSRLCHALKPGGRVLVDVVNRDYVIRSQPNLVWFEGEGCVVMEESDFNYFSSRLSVKRTMMREDGRQSDAEHSIRLYSLHELGLMLQQAGFRVKEVSGQEATRGVFFGSHSARLIMLAERRIAKGQSGPAMADAESNGSDGSK